MKKQDVMMVNPQQIVNKGLKGCSNARTVTAFAQKFGVPCVWWSPNRNQKVLLIDWPQFKTTWNQYWYEKTPTTMLHSTSRYPKSNYGTRGTTRYQPRSTTSTRSYTTPSTRTKTGRNDTRSYSRSTGTRRKSTRSY